MIYSLKTWWQRFMAWGALGKWVFSRLIGLFIPYTGTVSPHVINLGPGYAQVLIKDVRRHRNHLKSIHALALANVGELTTGLAIHFALEPNQRAILTDLKIKFVKKARGPITATAHLNLTNGVTNGPQAVLAELKNSQEVIVATVLATWLVGDNRTG